MLKQSLFRETYKALKQLTLYATTHHKGQGGRVGIIGGSFEYTGAPYYAALSALYAGAELSHIFCFPEAAMPIKAYSPENIVHPTLGTGPQNTTKWLPSIDCLVVGPGLGRTPEFTSELFVILKSALEGSKLYSIDIPVVIDADGIWYILQEKNPQIRELILKYGNNFTLTPNKAELDRVADFFKIEKLPLPGPISNEEGIFPLSLEDIPYIHNISKSLGMCGLIVKGPADIILVGKECYLNSINGSTKRCGGIGDILCGVCAQYWVFHNKTPSSISLANCFAGAVGLVRMASKAAQKERGLSLTAPFIINKLHEVWDIVEKSK